MEHHKSIIIPADVPENKHETFVKNYNAITRKTDRLFLFSCDHKIEHLNADFYGKSISVETLHPEHIFRIASGGSVGALATHLGLITRYAKQYPTVNYIIKLNAATHLVPHEQADPKSAMLSTVEDVIRVKHNNHKLHIPGVGITVYLGNTYESEHLAQAAQAVTQAHNEGLIAILWMYIRGKIGAPVMHNADIIAGAAGIGLSLGADFIKIKTPQTANETTNIQALKIACAAAGNSKIICAGGERREKEKYLQELYEQIHNGDSSGTATGRNIFQLSLQESIAFTHAISSIVYENSDYTTALALYHSKLEQKLS